ncbi:hypothetical protein ACH0BF_16465 [Pseudobacillus sp. 179-B 2D1 NHS]|uniref:hypothetical protein n=1 Tax=Pseudobacillus sp. 179-B 2D1 NHS TaxID=3374292 RepID=UPI0038797B4E
MSEAIMLGIEILVYVLLAVTSLYLLKDSKSVITKLGVSAMLISVFVTGLWPIESKNELLWIGGIFGSLLLLGIILTITSLFIVSEENEDLKKK